VSARASAPFPDHGHGPCSDCQPDHVDRAFDPWDIVAVPIWWSIMLGYWLKEQAEGFITRARRTK